MNQIDAYSELVADYVNNKCKLDPESTYMKNTEKVAPLVKPVYETGGNKDVFYTGLTETDNIIETKNDITHCVYTDLSKSKLDKTVSINLSYKSHIINILNMIPFSLIYTKEELIKVLPYISKISTHLLIYNGPDKLGNYMRQYAELLSGALKEKMGMDVLNAVLPLNRWKYVEDIKSSNISALIETDSIYHALCQGLFMSSNIQRTVPRYDIINEASKQLKRNLANWMYKNRYELLPNGTVLYTSLSQYAKQYNKEFKKTYDIINSSKNFYNPIEEDYNNSFIINNWNELDIFIKYIISLCYTLEPSKHELMSLAVMLNRPIIMMTGYKSKLYYSPLEIYTPFNYDKISDIPLCIISTSNNKYSLLWFSHFGSPVASLCDYPQVSNSAVHQDKKTIILKQSGSSKMIINKTPTNILGDILSMDNLKTDSLPEFLKKLDNTTKVSLNTEGIQSGGVLTNTPTIIINEAKTYKIGKFIYTDKVLKIAELEKKKLPNNIKLSDIPIDIFLYMRNGTITLFNLSDKKGQQSLNKAYKDGFIIRS
jgi:hypothetical protein